MIKIDVGHREEKKLRVVAYARVSTGYAEQIGSYENQVEMFMERINSTPEWDFAGVYADPAMTGTTDERPEFQRMIRDAERHKFDLILCKSISRFARNTLITIETIRHLQSIGVAVIFEKENIDTSKPHSEMMLTVLSAFAQEESRKPRGFFGRICTIQPPDLCAENISNLAINSLLLSAFRDIYVHAEGQTTKITEGKNHDERLHDEEPDGARKLQHQHHPRGFRSSLHEDEGERPLYL